MKKLLLALLIASLIYLIICVFVYFFQEHFIFFPQKGSVPPPEDLKISEHRITTRDGEQLHAWWMPVDTAEYTVLFFHGNAGNISRGEKRMRLFHEMGCNALAVDYRGYGISTGSIGKEEDIYEDANASWKYLTETLNILEEKIIIWGWSLGGAVAVDLAQNKNCHALVMESTFFRLKDISKKTYWFLPNKLLLRFRFTSGEKLLKIHAPVLFIHSKADKTIPYEHGKRLFEKFSGEKRFIDITGDHNHGIFDSQEKFISEAKTFMKF